MWGGFAPQQQQFQGNWLGGSWDVSGYGYPWPQGKGGAMGGKGPPYAGKGSMLANQASTQQQGSSLADKKAERPSEATVSAVAAKTKSEKSPKPESLQDKNKSSKDSRSKKDSKTAIQQPSKHLKEERDNDLVESLKKEKATVSKLTREIDGCQNDLQMAQQGMDAFGRENEELKAKNAQLEQMRFEVLGCVKKAEQVWKLQQTAMQDKLVDLEGQARDTAIALERSKRENAALEGELKAKEDRHRIAMEFNKRSMATAAKLNETTKSQEKELSETRFLKASLESELRARSAKVHELEMAAQQGGNLVSLEAIKAKDREIARLTSALQEMGGGNGRWVHEMPLRIGGTGKEYLGRMTRNASAGKRKRGERESGGEHLSKAEHAAAAQGRGSEPPGQDLAGRVATETSDVMTQMQTTRTRQHALEDAEQDHQESLLRKRCLEARQHIFREQLRVIERLTAQAGEECRSAEEQVSLMRNEAEASWEDLKERKSSLNNAQLLSTEIEVEKKVAERIEAATPREELLRPPDLFSAI